MSFVLLYLFGSILQVYCHGEVYSDDISMNSVIGQTCRDNANKPVPWWYIYKPPAGVVHPSGLNFSFVTPDTGGRWAQSTWDITARNMLSATLMPSYRRSYLNRVDRAMVIFESRTDGTPTSGRGVIMAGPDSGFLLTHSVPGFPGNFKSKPLFPIDELENGHLLACISLDFVALNKVARAIKEIVPNITFSHVPDSLANVLIGWSFGNILPSSTVSRIRPSIYSLIAVNESRRMSPDKEPVEAVLVARPPGVKSCIYSSFAARQLVMLNVYGQSESTYLTTVCGHGFGVRNLDSLCLKYERPDGDAVYYVTNSTDYTWFAVSTAAHWQQRGAGPRQFWACSSIVDKERLSGEGGMLLCLQNYNLWRAFDNLKLVEPSCA